MLLADYARNPLVLYTRDIDTGERTRLGAVVSDQLYLHVAGSFAFKYAMLSLDLPIALLNQGSNPAPAGFQGFTSPDSAALGDLRIGLRVPVFQLGAKKGGEPVFGGAITGYLWAPTGDQEQFTSDGAVRGAPGIALGGRASFIRYGLNAGVTFRPDRDFANAQLGTQITMGAAVAAVFADDIVQIGPEIYGNTVVGNAGAFERSTSNVEGVLGARARLGSFVVGAAGGPGFSHGVGTPAFRGLLSVAFAPKSKDTDGDGIVDGDDACKDVPGVASSDPTMNGCPDRDGDSISDGKDACPDVKGTRSEDPRINGCADGDGDGIADPLDACPSVAGVASDDPAKNGCPADRDADGIIDAQDACPDLAGPASDDPAKNGCPDRDGDGVVDPVDACPDLKGIASTDPAQNGCPGDSDGDGIRDDQDACPHEKGVKDADPTKNGCPTMVRVQQGKIEILQQVQFKTNSDVILPASDELLTQVANVLTEHPEITKVLVEGHTDSTGSKVLNQKLSEKRAASVVKWLVAHKVDQARLDSKGFGPSVPIADNKTPEGRQLNRRVEFKIIETKKLDGQAAPATEPAAPAAAPAAPEGERKPRPKVNIPPKTP